MTVDDLDSFTRAYVECALWSTNDESDPETGGEPMDKNYGPENIAPATLEKMAEDCRKFQEENAGLLAAANYGRGEWSDEEMAGHDFWLTRNHHGAGFWDRGLGETGRKLTDAAHAFGGFDLYVGDDGKIHH